MSKGECKISGCAKPVKESGMCSMHAARVRRHGDPHAVTHQRDRNLPRGEAHHSWTGTDLSYKAAHMRVKAKHGPASDHACVDCGAQARHWSFDHADPDARITDDGRPFSADPDHYLPRCVSCHKKHDCAVLIEAKGTLSAVPRCGKPIRAARTLARLGENEPPPICGRPAGHPGWCQSAESWQRKSRLRTLRPAQDGETAPVYPKPRCGHQLQPGHGDSSTCGRPQGHSGGHIGTEAYRRGLARTKALKPPQAGAA